MSQFFARCLRGLEGIAQEELEKIRGLRIVQQEIRTLFFDFDGDLDPLLDIRSLDDVFFHVGEIEELDHTRISLQKIPEALGSMNLDLDTYISKIRAIRMLSQHPAFTLTVGLQGKKNFSRFEVAEASLPEFQKELSGEYIPNVQGSKGAELDVRILMESQKLHVGLRLSDKPLHRRAYKLHNLPGSTKPPLAYALAKLAKIQPGDTVLDPFCGVGTVLVETSLGFSPAELIGLDRNKESLKLAKLNIQQAKIEADLIEGTATDLPFEKSSIDKIVSNPPWGRQVAKTEDLDLLYSSFFLQAHKVLKPAGRMVLLTDQEEWMQAYLSDSMDFLLKKEVELSLFGSVVKIYVLSKP